MKQFFKRGLSLAMSAILLLQTMIYSTSPAAAVSETSTDGSVAFGDTMLNHRQTLKQSGSSFLFTLQVESALAREDSNTAQNTSRNHYFTAPITGDYLVQVWGGKGGSGTDDVSPGGKGGAGGYVYGVVHLTAGETLYYQLGGDGQQTATSEEGGGINGDGGHHGEVGGMLVGGGGGYSAVYKFDAQEFERKYTDGAGNQTSEISDEDRATKYILIAGGGGGGGAGNGNSPLLGITAKGTADGGAAGSVGSTSGVLSGSGYDVEGTFFAGEDGKSSGDTANYVGRGATNVPGKIEGTALGSLIGLFEGKEPNDWRGTINDQYAGGGGGAGNLRGGAGGAGFCGGSGGVQSGLLSPTYIGGGGGGSSFIASTVTYTGIDSILGEFGQDSNPSSTGGAVYIRALDTSALSYLSDLSLTAQISPYFTALPQTGTNCSVSVSGDALTVSGIDLIENSYIRLELLFTPLSGFAGGNDVPLWNGSFTCTSNVDSRTVLLPVSDPCGYVNIPLTGFAAKGQSIDSNIAGLVYPVEALKGTDYADWPALQTQWKYAGIQNISDCTVDSSGDPTYNEDDQTVAPVETTYYPISFTVTPKPNLLAVVGTPVTATTYHGRSIIRIGENTDFLNGNTVSYSKELSYNETAKRYELKLTTSITSKPTAETTSEKAVIEPTAVASDGTITYDTYQAPVAGYYYIQAWGATGGTGSGALLGGDGGTGGDGRTESGYVYLEKDQILKIFVGAKGDNGGNSGGWIGRQNYGGKGGSASGVMGINGADAYELIAGGGGGGGGASGSSSGKAAQTNTVVNTGDRPTAITDAYNGGTGGTSGGAGGTAGANYRGALLDTVPTGKPALTTEAQARITTLSTGDNINNPSKSGTDGAVRITLIQQDFRDSVAIQDYTITAQLSDYFVMIDDPVYTGLAAGNNPDVQYVSIDNPGNNLITITNIDPKTKETKDPDTNETVVSTDDQFTVTLLLNPRDGFLGGNDVPLLKQDSTMKMQYQQADAGGELKTLGIAANPETDYANVVISDPNGWSKAANLTILSPEADPVTITAGDSVAHSQLYNKAELETLRSELAADAGWCDDYVLYNIHLVNRSTSLAESDDPLYPQQTTYYDVVLALDPLYPSPNAVCRDAFPGVEASGQALVKVLPRIVYDLGAPAHLVNSDKDALAATNGTIEADVDYTATLSANDGYVLPATITVKKRDGGGTVTLTAGTDYTYNSASGDIFISAAVIGYSEITIIATAEEATFILYYMYDTKPRTDPAQLPEHSASVPGLRPGDSLADTPPYTYVPHEYEGYDFRWSWEYGDGSPLTEMPDSNVWVMGTYVPKEYTLTIRYIKDGGGSAAADHQETVKYGTDYSVTSPVISGYLPDQAVVSGTMPANDVTVTVTYTGTANQLNILYFKEQIGGTLEQFDKYHAEDVTTGSAFSVPSPDLPGYTVEAGKEIISGTMTPEGITAQVIYRPNTYTVTLNANGGSCTTTELIAVYDNIYGYDPEASGYTTAGGYAGLPEKYRALPTPVRVGFDFAGWYLDKDVWARPVQEDTPVTETAGHTLYARWTGQLFTYTVKHVYENGYSVGSSAPDYTNKNMTVGDAVPPADYAGDYAITGYTPDKTRADLTGTMPAQNVVVTITYRSNTRTLTIHYVYADTVANEALRGTQAAPDDGGQVPIGGSYIVPSPTITGYTPSETEVSGTMGTENITVTVYYYDDDSPPVISVTVTWDTLSFQYTQGEWDPYTHTYAAEPIHPVSAGANYVMVTNNSESEIDVNATFSYEANAGFEDLTHYFTAADNRNAAHITQSGMLTPGGKAAKAFLWLQGTLPRNVTGTHVSGVCTVTITGGG